MSKYVRIEVRAGGAIVVSGLDGGEVARCYSDGADAVLRSALSDLTASTPTVDGPEGLTGPSAEGTWYGPLSCVPEGWEVRTQPGDGFVQYAYRRLGIFVEARPVPLPVTEEVPLHELRGRTLPGDRWPIDYIECNVEGVWHARRTPELWRDLPVSPSGMVTVQREVDEK